MAASPCSKQDLLWSPARAVTSTGTGSLDWGAQVKLTTCSAMLGQT